MVSTNDGVSYGILKHLQSFVFQRIGSHPVRSNTRSNTRSSMFPGARRAVFQRKTSCLLVESMSSGAKHNIPRSKSGFRCEPCHAAQPELPIGQVSHVEVVHNGQVKYKMCDKECVYTSASLPLLLCLKNQPLTSLALHVRKRNINIELRVARITHVPGLELGY
jgi:hypothetical protein